MNTYEQLSVIGQGQYGTCYKARHKGDGQWYCVKRISLGNKENHSDALKEAQLLSQLNHPNIISYKESFLEKDGALCIITSFCEEGDLFRKIKQKASTRQYFHEEEVMDMFIQIASALEYIHSRKVLHRDLKTQNIFIAQGGIIKLGDFGISKVLEKTDQFATTVTGTPYYMAPEICTNQPYTFKSDIWSLGCVLYELCTLKHAFAADSLLSLVYQIVRGNFPPISSERFSGDLSALVNSLLVRDMMQRPSLVQIFQVPYVQQQVTRMLAAQKKWTLRAMDSMSRRRGDGGNAADGAASSRRDSLRHAMATGGGGSSMCMGTGASPAGASVTASAFDSVVTPQQQAMEGLTPKQRLEAKKIAQRDHREMELKLACLGAARDRDTAAERKHAIVHGSNVGLPGGAATGSRRPGSIGASSPAGDPYSTDYARNFKVAPLQMGPGFAVGPGPYSPMSAASPYGVAPSRGYPGQGGAPGPYGDAYGAFDDDLPNMATMPTSAGAGTYGGTPTQNNRNASPAAYGGAGTGLSSSVNAMRQNVIAAAKAAAGGTGTGMRRVSAMSNARTAMQPPGLSTAGGQQPPGNWPYPGQHSSSSSGHLNSGGYGGDDEDDEVLLGSMGPAASMHDGRQTYSRGTASHNGMGLYGVRSPSAAAVPVDPYGATVRPSSAASAVAGFGGRSDMSGGGLLTMGDTVLMGSVRGGGGFPFSPEHYSGPGSDAASGSGFSNHAGASNNPSKSSTRSPGVSTSRLNSSGRPGGFGGVVSSPTATVKSGPVEFGGFRFGVDDSERGSSPFAAAGGGSSSLSSPGQGQAPSILNRSQVMFGVSSDSKPKGSFDYVIRDSNEAVDNSKAAPFGRALGGFRNAAGGYDNYRDHNDGSDEEAECDNEGGRRASGTSPAAARPGGAVVAGHHHPGQPAQDDEEEYEDDYEDYSDDFEDEPDDEDEEALEEQLKQRTQIIATVKGLTATLTAAAGSSLRPVAEAPAAAEVQGRAGLDVRDDATRALRTKCIQALGERDFKAVYDFLRRAREVDSMADSGVKDGLLQLVNGHKERLRDCFMVDMLIYKETMFHE